MSIYSWSLTAGANAGADAAINWSEGQVPSSVNDSARAMMAALVAHVRDSGASGVTAGTGAAYTLSLNQAMLSAIPALIGFKAHTNNTGACTLNVDTLGAFPLRAVTGVALSANAIVAGCVYLATWVAGSSEWLLLNPAVGAVPLAGGTMTGLLTLSGDPSTSLQAATKQYVDSSATTTNAHTVTGSGGLTGGGALSTNPVISVAAGGITSSMMASNSIVTAAITDANVTPAKLSQPLTNTASSATTSGTSVSFTSLPSWMTVLRVVLKGVSTNGTSLVRVRIGTGNSPQTTGYTYIDMYFAAAAQTPTGSSAGIDFGNSGATVVRYGVLEFVLAEASSNTWVYTGNILNDNTGQDYISGYVALSGPLDNVVLTTVNGTDAFDAGSVKLIYQ